MSGMWGDTGAAIRWMEGRSTKKRFLCAGPPPSAGRWYYIDDDVDAMRRTTILVSDRSQKEDRQAEEKAFEKTRSKFGPN